MTPSEFKAWFDGFTEAFTGCPTKTQWARIKERVAEIDGRPVTERVYVDRYIHRYWPTFVPTVPYYTCTALTGNAQGAAPAWNAAQNFNVKDDGHGVFCSSTAMNALGRAEAASLSS